MSEQIKAPAKINLFLDIVGVRPDGYHLLHSLFAPISIFDSIDIGPSSSDSVIYIKENGEKLNFENDTVSKAVKLFKNATAIQESFKISVTKKIPFGAGLGGGSSDAASVLSWLYHKYGKNISNLELNQISAKVGADVCFFLQKSAALVSGIGEKVQPCELESFNLVLAKPKYGISTVEAYGWFDQKAPNFGQVSRPFQISKPLTLVEILANLHNDLENPVEERHPGIRSLKQSLREQGALGALMSGSGSSVFGIFKSAPHAQVAAQALRQKDRDTEFFVCEVLTDAHPEGAQNGNHRS